MTSGFTRRRYLVAMSYSAWNQELWQKKRIYSLPLTLLPTIVEGVRVTKCPLFTLNPSTSTSQKALNREWPFTNKNESFGGVLNEAATILWMRLPGKDVNFGYKKMVLSVTINIKKYSCCRFGNVQFGFP